MNNYTILLGKYSNSTLVSTTADCACETATPFCIFTVSSSSSSSSSFSSSSYSFSSSSSSSHYYCGAGSFLSKARVHTPHSFALDSPLPKLCGVSLCMIAKDVLRGKGLGRQILQLAQALRAECCKVGGSYSVSLAVFQCLLQLFSVSCTSASQL